MASSEYKSINNVPLADTKARERLTTIEGKESGWDGKQEAITDIETIRSGASKGATAYQKPASGIPASDLADGVIPTIPTVTPLQTTGTAIATIGDITIYAPTGGSSEGGTGGTSTVDSDSLDAIMTEVFG